MAEWRFLRGWSSDALAIRLQRSEHARRNFTAEEHELTAVQGWQHYYSESLIAHEPTGDGHFARARVALANYAFSTPRIVRAHFDPNVPLLGRRMLLEIKVLGLRYLCPTIVSRVRDEDEVFGYRYDTLDGHIERGMEWFLVTKDAHGDIRFRIEARWQRGDLPNWWSRAGFALLAGHYQRTWHRQAHRRLSLLAYFGSSARPMVDPRGLTHQGRDVTFFYHPKPGARP